MEQRFHTTLELSAYSLLCAQNIVNVIRQSAIISLWEVQALPIITEYINDVVVYEQHLAHTTQSLTFEFCSKNSWIVIHFLQCTRHFIY